MSIELGFGPCPRESIWCENRTCWNRGIKPENCGADNVEAMQDRYRTAFRRDTAQRGYRVLAVEAHIYLLNVFDRDAHFERRPGQKGERTTSFHAYIRQNAERFPYVRPNPAPSINAPENYDRLSVVRGSGLVHDECDLQRIISNAYDDEDFATIAGTGLHIVTNQQHVDDYFHNKLLMMLGLPPIKRSEYCEKEIFCSIEGVPFLGHPDAILDIGGSAIGVLDLKRSGVPRTGYRMQMLSYAIAANQEFFGDAYREYFLINVLHANPGMPVTPQNPSYRITVVKKGGLLETELRKEIVRTHEIQQLLRNDLSLFEEYKRARERSRSRKPGRTVCEACYATTRARCDALREAGLTVDQHLAKLSQPREEPQ